MWRLLGCIVYLFCLKGDDYESPDTCLLIWKLEEEYPVYTYAEIADAFDHILSCSYGGWRRVVM
jgi:hypothetical protein